MTAQVTERGAELQFVNGTVLTMDADRRVASALAVDGGRIVLVGSDEEVLATRRPASRVVDLGGRTVVPGLIDAHTHVELTTYSRHFWTDVRGRSRAEVLRTVTDLAAGRPAGEWVVLQGTFGQDLPDRAELDRAAPDHPVAVRWSMHKFQLNSAALAVSGIDRRTVAEPGMRLNRDSGGELTGLVEEGWDLLAWEPPLRDALRPAIAETLTELFLRNGVTSINEVAASAAGVRVYQELGRTGNYPRMGLALTAAPGHQALVDTRNFSGLGFATGFGDSRCHLQAVKIFLDGGRDGAFRSNGIGGPADSWGLLSRTLPGLTAELAAAMDAGLQVWVHAIGDLAQECAVSAIEQAARSRSTTGHRFRVEHFGNEMYEADRLRRLVDAGGIPVPNPSFVFAEPDDPGRRLPPHTVKYGLRTLRSLTGVVVGNSDTAGAQPFACNPWFVMQCMILRRNRNGVVVDPEEAVGIDEALAAFTRDAAYATFQEEQKGTLEAGKLADFAVLETDPRSMPAQELDSMVTAATVIGGRVVHGGL
ncbi:amidohydrolase [Thermobifida halotolerans]|uniref:Amidohydrolase n=1 Tax=Thermobifida halotolerans TaxID=483545 RepID=A0A399G610_9ACTN|nr:amidohydrolase [Thermobifida halotolerans]UOE20586.1 amidohydrolase [Thermobifida halotolerans]